MRMIDCVAALAVMPMVIGPVLANPCVSCRVVKRAPVKILRQKEIIIKREVATIAVPFFVPAYVAQVLPAPAVTYNITTPPPPAQATQQITAATYITPPAVGIYGAAAIQAPAHYPTQALTANPNDRLMAFLDKLDKRLCRLEENAGIQDGNGNGNAEIKVDPGIPKVLATKCVACHTPENAKKEGGGFVLFDKGKLAPLSERNLRLIGAKTYGGEMPPKSNKFNIQPLNDQDVADIQEWLRKQK